MRRRGAVHPVIFTPEPGPAAVVAPPIIADAEGHDADAELRAEIQYRDAAVLIVIVQITAVHPATIAFPVHIAPRPIIEAAAHIQ
jgi:hypothetical protein